MLRDHVPTCVLLPVVASHLWPLHRLVDNLPCELKLLDGPFSAMSLAGEVMRWVTAKPRSFACQEVPPSSLPWPLPETSIGMP